MSQFSGKQGKGAMRARRAEKRLEAEARNDPGKKLLKDIYTIPAADIAVAVVEDVSSRPAKRKKKKVDVVSISERGVRSRR